MRKIHVLALILTGAMIILSGCSKNMPPDWYNVTGSGMASQDHAPGQARLMAKRAAEKDADRQLLEAAKGVHISSNTTVEDFMAKNDYIRSRVEGIIRGSQVIDTRYNSDGTCEVDKRIDMNQIRNLVR